MIALHTAVTTSVSHAARIKSERYFCWQEDSRDDLISDGKHTEKKIIGITDLFTKLEFDEWFDLFEQSLDASRVEWQFISTTFDENTKTWHHQWQWAVIYHS